MSNVVGKIPEFTTDETIVEGEKEEVKETPVEEAVEEKETPAEPPAEKEPVSPKTDVDAEDLTRQIEGLQKERVKLLEEIVHLKGERRELKTQDLIKVEEKLDELKDVSPQDVELVERILKRKGYITNEQAHQMFYKAVEQEEINKFLNEFPEYKPENDPQNLNWGTLEREMSFYRKPDNPHDLGFVLRKAHRSIVKPSGDQNVAVKKQQVKTAGVGSGGTQRSSSVKTLDPDKRALLVRGGWSEEEIKKIEQNLPE